MKRFKAGAIVTLLLTSTANVCWAESPVLPNSITTSGAINTSVTQNNIGSTICKLGYSTRIRPPASFTTKLKISQLSSYPYSAYGSKNTSLFEEDHLISLELGGSPTSTKNLWPEPWDGPFGAHVKDQLENKLHALVCSHQMPLIEAQGLIASNWYAAYQTYVLGMSTEPTPTPTPKVSITPSPAPVVTPTQPFPTPSPTLSSASLDHPANATGKCKDGTFSYAATHSGMCSGHGGVAQFYP
jgi:hypothetical protein